jgi:hypothetical protein
MFVACLWHICGIIANAMGNIEPTTLEAPIRHPYNRAPMVGKKKPATARKSLLVRVRLSPEQHDLINRAAEHSALTVSGWMRSVAVAEARRLLESDKPTS